VVSMLSTITDFRSNRHLLHPLYQQLHQTWLHGAYRNVRNVIAETRQLSRWILYFLSGLVPRQNDLWVFGTYRNDFSDNSKYLFCHVAKVCPDIRPVWISGSERTVTRMRALGFEAYLRDSWPGWWYCLRARCYFFIGYSSDINFFASRGALLINLWHGTPIKRIEFDIRNGPDARLFDSPTWRVRLIKEPALYRGCDFVISASPFVSAYAFSSAFRVPLERCLSLGYPKTDLLFQDRATILDQLYEFGEIELARQLERFKSAGVTILYLPTWREASAHTAERQPDWSTIDKVMKSQSGLFVIKPHPLAIDLEQFPKKGDFQHIVVLPAESDVYPLMVFADMLLTDYSSVMFEFCLTGRPIILVAFDLEQYEHDDRGFYLPLEKVGIGRIVRNSEQLMKALDEVLREPLSPTYDEESVSRFNSYRAGGASDRVASYFAKFVQVEGTMPILTRGRKINTQSGTKDR
jgi:CDP-glycerol glycerophosphotransferase (TagB/SpsB family)